MHLARSLEVQNHEISDYFVSEVLDQQPPEIVRFMLDTSVLSELTAETCAALTGRPDAEALLRRTHRAHLFLVALDDGRTRFRYHDLARQLLRAELRVRDRAREQSLQRRAAEWFESAGNARRAARHFLAAQQAGRALSLLDGHVVTDFLRDPALPPPELGVIDSKRLTDEPDRLLALATDLLLSGDAARGGACLDTLDGLHASLAPDAKLDVGLTAARSLHHLLTGRVDESVAKALSVQAMHKQTQLAAEWNAAVPLILLHGYTWLEDVGAVEREAAAALAGTHVTEPVKHIVVPGSLALCWFEAGRLPEAADAAEDADRAARGLGPRQHFLAVDFLRVLAGLALERRDFDTADRLTEQALSIGRQQPLFEFLAMLDGAAICGAREQVGDALASVDAARRVLAGTGSVLLARADELEALLRLQLGDLRSATELATKLPAIPRHLLLARIALATGDYPTAQRHLQAPSQHDLTPRRALVRQLLLAALAIRRSDPMTASIMGNALLSARRGGFCNTVVTTVPEVTTYVIEHAAPSDSFTEGLIAAALEVRSARPRTCRPITEPLTPAERRVLDLLPTGTCPQIAATLYVSPSTVKTHLRSIYQKLGAASRSEALGRAADLQLL
jgi:LuxR family maltose regulon positive regulatory protein